VEAQASAKAVPFLPASLKVSVSASSRSAFPSLLPAVPLDLVGAAEGYLGVPYVHGGDSRLGVDCSGLIYRVFHDILGMDLPRGVDGLFRTGRRATAPLHVGDLVFFDTNENATISTPTHVGVYAGGGRFVHAASEGSHTGVIVSALDAAYYRDRFLGARRVFPWRPPVMPITVTDDHRVLAESSPFASREPLSIEIYNGMTGGGPLDFAVLKDGRPVITQRIVPGAQKPAEISLVPDVGTWTVRVSRIFKGRELSNLTFVVEE
jgi:hypothetical protein